MPDVTRFGRQMIVEINQGMIDDLKAAARRDPRRRSRLCLHPSTTDPLHEMVIAFCREGYIRPHRHQGKSESFHIIEGRLDVIFFDDIGKQTRRVAMGPPDSGLTFFYRLGAELWHTVLPRSDTVVIHETTNGPFNPQEAEFAPWSPDGINEQEVADFMRKIAA